MSTQRANLLLHNFLAQYKTPPGGKAAKGANSALVWLQSCVKESLRLVHAAAPSDDDSADTTRTQLQHVSAAVQIATRAIRTQLEQHSEEAVLRAGEMVGLSNFVDDMQHDISQRLQQNLTDKSDLEGQLREAKQDAATLAAQLDTLQTTTHTQRHSIHETNTQNAALHAEVATLRSNITALSSELAHGRERERILRDTPPRSPKIHTPAPPKECACAGAKEAAMQQVQTLSTSLGESAVVVQQLNRTVEELTKEVTMLRARFGLVDSAVEDVKAVFPKTAVPKRFYRCGPDDTRWTFGTRTIILTPAGEHDAVVSVGGGCLPLREFVKRTGELEVSRERRSESFRLPRRAASLR